jgi:hypothetical protein
LSQSFALQSSYHNQNSKESTPYLRPTLNKVNRKSAKLPAVTEKLHCRGWPSFALKRPPGQGRETRVADPRSGVRKIGIDTKFMPE